jgi:molybdenum cofactor cytidylyltransferase
MALNNNYPVNIGAIILAAGDSSRLGRPKQLLNYAGQSLLQHSIDSAAASGAQPVVVVLGSNAELIKKQIGDNKVHVVINNEWNEGMASSIRCGLNTILELNPSIEGIILLLCDQPHVTRALLANLMATHRETGKLIVASYYRDTFGPPVFFHKTMFPGLLLLNGDVGAKGLISQHTSEMHFISFVEGTVDIDTEGDYQNLSNDNRAL